MPKPMPRHVALTFLIGRFFGKHQTGRAPSAPQRRPDAFRRGMVVSWAMGLRAPAATSESWECGLSDGVLRQSRVGLVRVLP
jgi:hypothetical protein